MASALVSDAAAAGLKVALHEVNTQRASLMKSLSDSQKKLSELTGNNDALSISVAQLEKERDGLLDEIQEYRQVLAAADRKINEYEAAHARSSQPTSPAAAPKAWNLSDPARGVSQGDTCVRQRFAPSFSASILLLLCAAFM